MISASNRNSSVPPHRVPPPSRDEDVPNPQNQTPDPPTDQVTLGQAGLPDNGLIPPPPRRNPGNGLSLRAHFINDNMPSSWSRHIVSPDYQIPRTGGQSDDDGYTAMQAIDGTYRRPGGRETVFGARLQMVTETGSWTGDPNFRGRRTDIGEVYLQENRTRTLSDGAEVTTGVGAGVQAFGNLGGESIQRWFHRTGPFGGRVGDRLQSEQTRENIRFVPTASGGLGYRRGLTPNLTVDSSVQATLPVGRGLAVGRVEASATAHLGPFQGQIGGRLDAAVSTAEELSFHNRNGVRAGAFARVEVGDSRRFGAFAGINTGGFRNEAILDVGVRIGLGGGPRLNPGY